MVYWDEVTKDMSGLRRKGDYSRDTTQSSLRLAWIRFFCEWRVDCEIKESGWNQRLGLGFMLDLGWVVKTVGKEVLLLVYEKRGEMRGANRSREIVISIHYQ